MNWSSCLPKDIPQGGSIYQGWIRALQGIVEAPWRLTVARSLERRMAALVGVGAIGSSSFSDHGTWFRAKICSGASMRAGLSVAALAVPGRFRSLI